MNRFLRQMFGTTRREAEGARLMATREVEHAALMHRLDESTKETVQAAERVERAGEALLRRLREDLR